MSTLDVTPGQYARKCAVCGEHKPTFGAHVILTRQGRQWTCADCYAKRTGTPTAAPAPKSRLESPAAQVVIKLVAQGRSIREIIDATGLTYHTIWEIRRAWRAENVLPRGRR